MTVNKLMFCGLINLIICGALLGQGLISELSDTKGYLARLGSKGLNKTHLLLGNNKIQTNALRLSILGQPIPPAPTLHLNPVSGKVTIGNTYGDSGALTIRSFSDSEETRDLQFENHGNIGTEGSLFINLDDDNNANEFFTIKNSKGTNIFRVGENGSNFLLGNLVVAGQIVSTNVRVNDIFTIGYSDVEALNQYGDELFVHHDGLVYGDNNDNFISAQLGASINLPHNASITKVEVYYRDHDDEGYFCVGLYSMDNLSSTKNLLWEQCSSAEFSSTYWQKWSHNINVPIDNLNKIYAVEFVGRNYGETLGFRQMKIYFDY